MPSRSDPPDSGAAGSGLITADVDEAVEALRNGGVVAIPTETVYGLAARADDATAVRRVFEIKGRPTDHPLILHVADSADLDGWVGDLPRSAVALATVCWPGPLTMLLGRGARTGRWVTGGRETVGVRVPAHPMTTDMLSRLGTAVAAPSANRFGRVSPTSAGHVVDDLAGRLDPGRDRILDGGTCRIGVESTIVDLTVTPPQLLRAGAIDAESIERILDAPVVSGHGPSRAAGMLSSHYSPACAVVLVEPGEDLEGRVAQLIRGGALVHVVDRTSDLVDAARCLYDDLREADRRGADVVVARLPAASGLGHALRDRLTKAAAPR